MMSEGRGALRHGRGGVFALATVLLVMAVGLHWPALVPLRLPLSSPGEPSLRSELHRASAHGRRLFRKADNEYGRISPDRLLIYRALKAVGNWTDVVYFNGLRAKSVLDTSNPLPHFLLNGKVMVRAWKTIAEHINATRDQQEKHPVSQHFRAVHVHNEFQFGDLLLTVMEEHRRNKLFRFPKEARSLNLPAEDVHRAMDHHQPPIVLTNTIDENWGFLSTVIVNRTTKWINMTNHLRLHYSSQTTARHFLDSEKIALVLTSSHVDPEIGFHRKVISLPLGIKARQFVFYRARMLLALEYTKTRLLTINNSGWGPRSMINALVSAAFNHSVVNSYDRRARGQKKATFRLHNSTEEAVIASDHFLEIAQSKFVLCPSGLGFDTYRMWEVLLLGSIPIIETNPGLDRTVASLPVLIVRNFNDVTPQLLEQAYPCFVQHALDFNFEHLREDYWLRLIRRALETASADHVMEQHPFKHKFCNFV